MYQNNYEPKETKQNPTEFQIDIRQKITDYRKDIRKQQQRDIISNKRFFNSRSYQTQPKFDTKIDHLTNNPNSVKLVPKINEWVNSPVDSKKLNEYLLSIRSNDIFQQHYGIISIRKLLCENNNVFIQEIIDNNALPIIIELARNNSERHLQFEATWCLANMASGTSEQTHTLIQHNVINVFITLAQSEYIRITEQAIWGLGNISADCFEFRNLVLKSAAPDILIQVYSRNTNNSLIVSYVNWVFSNLCRIKAEKEGYSPVIESLLKTLISIFTAYNNTEILEDALIGFSTYAKNKYIGLFCGEDFLYKLQSFYRTLLPNWSMNIAKISHIHVILGGVTGSEDSNTDKVIKIGFLSDLVRAMNIPHTVLQKEICWVISNIALGSDAQVSALLNEPGLIDRLFEFACHEDEDLSKEALWTFCNFTKSRVLENFTLLFSKGLLELFNQNLESDNDTKKILLVLEAIIQLVLLFRCHSDDESINPVISRLVNIGIANKIEKLQHHPAEMVYAKAFHILDKYFDLDETNL